jgi:hypothetical protein
MKKAYASALFFTASLGSALAETQTWRFSGALDSVSASLSSYFSIGDTLSISMDVDTSVAVYNPDRPSFYQSTGSYRDAVSNGSVTVDGWYDAAFESVSNLSGTIDVINTAADAFSGYDQLTMTFNDGIAPDSVTGPNVGSYEISSIEFNFYNADSPFEMILGNGASYPNADIAFPVIGETFFPDLATNAYEFRIRFAGDGQDMITGSLTLVPEPSDGIWLMAAAGMSALAWRRLRGERKAA